jgi:enoyl-CoA hydratase/carnithine racemase
MMTFQTLHIEKNNNVLTIFLNRPEKRNALNALMCHELRTALA